MKKFKLKGKALVQKHCTELFKQAKEDGLPFGLILRPDLPTKGIAYKREIREEEPKLMTIKHYQEESQKFLNRMHGGIWGNHVE